MSFYTLCQKDGLQVHEPTYKYVDNQTLCLAENADWARSFSLTRPHWREGLLLCQRICIVSVFIAKILKIFLDISLKNGFWSVWARFRLACLLYDGWKSIGSKSEGWILQWPPQKYFSISIRFCWSSLRIWKIKKNCGRVEAVIIWQPLKCNAERFLLRPPDS